MKTRNLAAAAALAAVAVGTLAGTARADTVAYLRFEEGAEGEQVQPISTAPNGAAVESAGGDDNFAAFAPANAPFYAGNVPGPTVPQTGAANTLSLDFPGGQDVYSPTLGPLRTTDFDNFTIEAFVRFEAIGNNFRTIVGRDDNGSPGQTTAGDFRLSQFYLQKTAADRFAVTTFDSTGALATVTGTTPVAVGVWYHVAAVASADTDRLTLYVNGTAEGTPATFTDGLIDSAADTIWTVGRGQYNNNVGDFVDGQIDEVRWSDAALAPTQFLNAEPVPEPGVAGLLALAGLAALRRRRAVSAHAGR